MDVVVKPAFNRHEALSLPTSLTYRPDRSTAAQVLAPRFSRARAQRSGARARNRLPHHARQHFRHTLRRAKDPKALNVNSMMTEHFIFQIRCSCSITSTSTVAARLSTSTMGSMKQRLHIANWPPPASRLVFTQILTYRPAIRCGAAVCGSLR